MAEETRRVVMVRMDAGNPSVTGLEGSLVGSIDGIHFRRRTERLFGTFSGIVIFDGKEYEMVPGSHVSYEVERRVVTEAKYILKVK
ncbi:MAG: hypothetical protein AABX71_03490 [Nanoarchaeota archaeon]